MITMQYARSGMVLSDNAAKSMSRMVVEKVASGKDGYHSFCNGIVFLLVLSEVAKGNIPADDLHLKTISGRHLTVDKDGRYTPVDNTPIEEDDFVFDYLKSLSRNLSMIEASKVYRVSLVHPGSFNGVTMIYNPGAARHALSDFHVAPKIKSIAKRVESGDNFDVVCSSGILFEKMPEYVIRSIIPYQKIRFTYQGRTYPYSPIGSCDGVERYVMTHEAIEREIVR